MKKSITLKINGRERSLEVKPNEILLNVLRERFDLMGSKYGCGIGECGACTVLLNGRAVLSCQILAISAAGQEITTIEGISNGAALHPLQDAFIEEGAVQCGFCTPGMIMSAKALLDKNPDPTNEQIKEAIRGNLCRCTGYTNIISAVKSAARRMIKE
ncbi:MAG: 2Fe-2S iron-sulfur cluster binding domain-containing protein [Spirochaeta sp.]|nr:2Fe-2S iron-sulfur cluster binding domain-containing protein [Spirochaeta sp.]